MRVKGRNEGQPRGLGTVNAIEINGGVVFMMKALFIEQSGSMKGGSSNYRAKKGAFLKKN